MLHTSESTETSADVAFMLQRCIGLCLTDTKAPLDRAQYVDFDITNSTDASSVSLYKPLTELTHAQGVISSFLKGVIPRVQTIAGGHRSTAKHGASSPSSSTLRSALQVPATRAVRRTLSDIDSLISASVGEEFVTQCEMSLSILEAQRDRIKNPSLLSFLARSRLQTSMVRNRWNSLVDSMDLPTHIVKAALKSAVGDNEAFAIHMLDDFEATMSRHYDEWISRSRLTRRLIHWRKMWRETTSGFSPGSKLRLDQTRNPPGLFELWAFTELANALVICGQASLVQASLLRSREETPLFSGMENREIYYDFYGHRNIISSSSFPLSRVHVEWFFRNSHDYSKSLVCDAKYKSFESVNLLTTLGYMNAFQVTRGAVIFRGAVDSLAFQTSDKDQRCVISKFGADKKHMLCALQLVPRSSELDSNRTALTRLIEEVILP